MHRSNNKLAIVTLISCYRILAAPILFLFICIGAYDLFKWLIALSFLTDAVDGYVARGYKVVSAKGARLDSVGDDLTVIVAVLGMAKWNYAFIWEIRLWAALLILLLIIQVSFALFRYGKMTAFHTYLSKTAAVLQAIFLSSSFLLGHPWATLFYLTAIATAMGLIEEIVIISLLRDYRVDVKGLYWLIRMRRG